MRLENPATHETASVRVDNTMERADGLLIIEAMFSSVVDLSGPPENVVARIHPVKAMVFEWIVTGSCRTPNTNPQSDSRPTISGPSSALVRDVELHVNRPGGDVLVRHFSECIKEHRQLLSKGASGQVRRTVALPGFDQAGCPVAREMADGSVLIVFLAMPPLQPASSFPFDMDAFGQELTRAAGTDVVWDDRDVFVIPRPGRGCLESLRRFVAEYPSVQARR